MPSSQAVFGVLVQTRHSAASPAIASSLPHPSSFPNQVFALATGNHHPASRQPTRQSTRSCTSRNPGLEFALPAGQDPWPPPFHLTCLKRTKKAPPNQSPTTRNRALSSAPRPAIDWTTIHIAASCFDLLGAYISRACSRSALNLEKLPAYSMYCRDDGWEPSGMRRDGQVGDCTVWLPKHHEA